MCIETLKAVKSQCGGGNMGKLKQRLHIAYSDAVATTPAPEPNTHLISGDFVMRSANATASPPVTAGVFYPWDFSKYDNGYEAEAVGDDENVSYVHKLKLRVNKMSSEKDHMFNGLLGRGTRVIFKDGNGLPKMMGDQETPATIKIIPGSADKNGYAIEISYESPNLLYTYVGAIPVGA